MRFPIVDIAGHTATLSFSRWPPPAGFVPHHAENFAQAPAIDRKRTGSNDVRSLEQFQPVCQWVGLTGRGDLINERFTCEHTRRRKNRSPRSVPDWNVDRHIRSLNRWNYVGNVVHTPG